MAYLKATAISLKKLISGIQEYVQEKQYTFLNLKPLIRDGVHVQEQES